MTLRDQIIAAVGEIPRSERSPSVVADTVIALIVGTRPLDTPIPTREEWAREEWKFQVLYTTPDATRSAMVFVSPEGAQATVFCDRGKLFIRQRAPLHGEASGFRALWTCERGGRMIGAWARNGLIAYIVHDEGRYLFMQGAGAGRLRYNHQAQHHFAGSTREIADVNAVAWYKARHPMFFDGKEIEFKP